MSKKTRFAVYISTLYSEMEGNGYLVSVKTSTEKVKFLVDCGRNPTNGKKEEVSAFNEAKISFPFNVQNLAFALATHGHMDHIFEFPMLVKSGFGNRIYTTHDTKTIMDPALTNSCEIIKSNCLEPLYTLEDKKRTLDLVKSVDYRKTIKVTPSINVTFFENAHIPGAACILVQVKDETTGEEINLFFTGDYKSENIFFDVPPLPDWVLNLSNLVIITESTYGNVTSENISFCFRHDIAEAVSQRKDINICSIALDRMQHLLYELRCMQDIGEIPKDYPIFVDGTLAQIYTEIYSKGAIHLNDEMLDFLPENLKFICKGNRKDIMQITPKIVLSTSGMGSFGPAPTHILDVLDNKAGLQYFTCYLAEGTLGRQLKEATAEDVITINGKNLIKRGEVKFTEEFSAHSKSDELINSLLKKFKNPQTILIHHGCAEAEEAFARKCKEELDAKDVYIMNKEEYYIINTNGLKGTGRSNF